MTVVRAGAPDWLSVFPVEEEVGTWSTEPNKALFVDIGGSFGHQCRAFKAKYPNLPGRIILQDIPQTLEHVPPIEGVEVMVQNFFEPQAIKGKLDTQNPAQSAFLHWSRSQILLPAQCPPRLAR